MGETIAESYYLFLVFNHTKRFINIILSHGIFRNWWIDPWKKKKTPPNPYCLTSRYVHICMIDHWLLFFRSERLGRISKAFQCMYCASSLRQSYIHFMYTTYMGSAYILHTPRENLHELDAMRHEGKKGGVPTAERELELEFPSG